MTVSVLCSCGVFLRTEKAAMLIDAPNDGFAPFSEFPDEELQKIIKAEPPYDVPLCIAFTHTHPDHYSESKLDRIRKHRPETQVILPSAKAQEYCLFGGEFSVFTYPVSHTPAPAFPDSTHNVIFISSEISVYITADALCDVTQHRLILGGRKADAAFWNGQYLSYPETRKLLSDAAKQNYIYHNPVDAEDVSGIRRKAERSMRRFGEELKNTELILSYPYTVKTV